MDECLEYFLSHWGQPTERVPADEETLTRFAPHLPATLIEYWRELGFSVFQDGLMTLCNPIEWQPVIDEWIEDTELKNLDTFIPVMRGALGSFKLFGIQHGCRISLLPVDRAYVGTRDQATYGMRLAIESLFLADPKEHDLQEEKFTFPQALKKLGPLKPNEMYGFIPLLPLGGMRDLAHLQKVDAFAHLSILRQATGELRGIMEYADIYR